MTNTITTYVAGYTLGAGGVLDITVTGTIGGAGLTADSASKTLNKGKIFATVASAGTAANVFVTYTLYPSGYTEGVGYTGGSGGAGGQGAYLASATLTNSGIVIGGAGGAGGTGANVFGSVTYADSGAGGAAGAGGAGVLENNGYVLNNLTRKITGGAGGEGGAAGSAAGPVARGGVGSSGGYGGAGVSLLGGRVVNAGSITGGAGGHGGAGGYAFGYFAYGGDGGYGGSGGAGASAAGGSLTNSGAITGGAGGAGGAAGGYGDGMAYGRYGTTGHGGAGAAGVSLSAGALLTNSGQVAGGAGGTGYSSPSGRAGDGVDVRSAGSVVNQAGGTIQGYIGVTDLSGGYLTVTSAGVIIGSAGDSVAFNASSDRLIVESGATFSGGIGGGGGVLELAGGPGTLTGLGSSAGTLSGAASGTFSGFGAYVVDAGAAWTVSGSQTITAPDELSNGGTLSLGASSHLTIVGALNNVGLIDVAGAAGSAFASLVFSGAETLTGVGIVSLSANGRITASKSASLSNLGNTVEGGGDINGSLSLTNEGTIDSSVGRMLINTTSSVVNDGLIENTGAATLLIRNTTIDSSGGGLMGDGHRIQLDNATLLGGALSISKGASLIAFLHAGTVNLSGGTVQNAGFIDGAALGLTIQGAVNNTGYVQADNGALTITGALTGTGQARIMGAGVLELDGASAEHVVFTASSTGEMVFGDIAGFTGRVFGFSKTGANKIDIKGLAFVSGETATYSGTATGGKLTLSSGATVLATISFSGDYRASTFTAADDTAGGTVITDPPASAPLTSAMAAFGAGGGSTATVAAASASTAPVLARPSG